MNSKEWSRILGEGLYNFSSRFLFYKSWGASIALLDQHKCRKREEVEEVDDDKEAMKKQPQQQQ